MIRKYLNGLNNTGGDRGYIVVRGIGKYKNWMMVPFKIEDKTQDQEDDQEDGKN